MYCTECKVTLCEVHEIQRKFVRTELKRDQQIFTQGYKFCKSEKSIIQNPVKLFHGEEPYKVSRYMKANNDEKWR